MLLAQTSPPVSSEMHRSPARRAIVPLEPLSFLCCNFLACVSHHCDQDLRRFRKLRRNLDKRYIRTVESGNVLQSVACTLMRLYEASFKLESLRIYLRISCGQIVSRY